MSTADDFTSFEVIIRTIDSLNSTHAQLLEAYGVELRRKTNVYQSKMAKIAIENLATQNWVLFIAMRSDIQGKVFSP
jgi:hypothetical protein